MWYSLLSGLRQKTETVHFAIILWEIICLPKNRQSVCWKPFHVTEDEVFITDKNTGVIPMVCQYSSGPLRFEKVYFLEDYTETEALAHGIRNYGGVALRIEDLEKWSSEILGDWILPVSQILNTDYQG